MRSKSVLLLIFGFTIGIGFGYAIFVGTQGGFASLFQSSPEPVLQTWSPEVGSEAPDFELRNLAGDPIRLVDLQGQVVLLNFWASWCGPCIVEMPILQDRYERFKPLLNILAVNAGEDQETASQFVDEHGLKFPVLLDSDGNIQQIYRVRGLPTSLIIDEKGIIRVHHIGGLTSSQLDKYLEQLGVTQ